MALPASDTFSSGSTQTLTSYSGNWTILEGGFSVNASGLFYGTGGTYNTARWNADTFAANQYAQVTLDNGEATGIYCGPAVRCQSGANTSYHCEGAADQIYVSKCLAGSQSVLSGPIAQTLATGDVLRLEVTGTGGTVTLRVYRAAAASPTSFVQIGSDITDSSSPITTAGYAGIFVYGGTADVGATAWSAGDLVAVPSAPTGVTGGSVTSSSATCSWTDASSDETSFDVQYAPSPYSSWTTLSGSPTAANATSLATGSGVLTDGLSYKFRVRSTNSAGSSSWVESGVFTTPSLTRLRPNADTTVGTATSTGANLYGVLDETTRDDADYITIPGTLTSVSLVQGHPSETNIKTWTPTPGASFALGTLTMTSGEASAITDYSLLYIKIVTSSTTVKLKFENATDPGDDNDHALVWAVRQA